MRVAAVQHIVLTTSLAQSGDISMFDLTSPEEQVQPGFENLGHAPCRDAALTHGAHGGMHSETLESAATVTYCC